MTKRLSKYRRWAKANPQAAARHNALRRKRTDSRDQILWARRLRLLKLHCGEFSRRERDRYYESIEVRLTVLELATLWFRDKAWTMHKPEVDRIDPDGHYDFLNCRFLEKKENLARRRYEKVPF